MKNSKISKRQLRYILVGILACIFVFCAVQVVRSYIDETEGGRIYNEAAVDFISMDTAPEKAQTQDTTAPAATGSEPATEESTEAVVTQGEAAPVENLIKDAALMRVDFDRLKKINPDIVAWIAVDNTTISYPILHGSDNEKYLDTTYNNRRSKYGSIFIDYRLESDFSARNTIIYGHNMRNSSMFGTLLKFSRQSYFDSRRFFYIITPDGTFKYEIFSAYKADVGSATYIAGFSSDSSFSDFITKICSWSEVKTGITPDVSDMIVTLSTCTSSSSEKETKRYVVHGRLVKDAPETPVGPSAPPAGEPETQPVPDMTTVPPSEQGATEPADSDQTAGETTAPQQ